MRFSTAQSIVRGRSVSRLLIGLLALSSAGCTDVGDNSATPPLDANAPPVDATMMDASSPGTDGEVPEDAGAQDSGVQGTTPSDDGPGGEPPETGTVGGGEPEAGGAEAGGADAGGDAASSDSGASDAGGGDTGAPDTGGPDAGPDAGAHDSGTDGAAGLVPCTASGQTGCVGCYGSAGNVCTPTEAIFVNLDIAKGLVTAAGPEPDDMTASCYSCLVYSDCIDNAADGITGTECDALSGNFTNGSGASVPAEATCNAVVACIAGSQGMQCAATALSYCYCGPGGGPSAQCQGANASMVNGPCIDPEVAGFPYTKTSASSILGAYSHSTLPSGLANSIFACAISNHCASCL
jgi:hypothetical protein